MLSTPLYLGFGAPGIQEIIVILVILGTPLAIVGIVLFFCLRKKPVPPPLPQQPPAPEDKPENS